jgi:hypothetical protein
LDVRFHPEGLAFPLDVPIARYSDVAKEALESKRLFRALEIRAATVRTIHKVVPAKRPSDPTVLDLC